MQETSSIETEDFFQLQTRGSIVIGRLVVDLQDDALQLSTPRTHLPQILQQQGVAYEVYESTYQAAQEILQELRSSLLPIKGQVQACVTLGWIYVIIIWALYVVAIVLRPEWWWFFYSAFLAFVAIAYCFERKYRHLKDQALNYVTKANSACDQLAKEHDEVYKEYGIKVQPFYSNEEVGYPNTVTRCKMGLRFVERQPPRISSSSLASELEKLFALKQSGALTEEEYQQGKTQVLSHEKETAVPYASASVIDGRLASTEELKDLYIDLKAEVVGH